MQCSIPKASSVPHSKCNRKEPRNYPKLTWIWVRMLVEINMLRVKKNFRRRHSFLTKWIYRSMIWHCRLNLLWTIWSTWRPISKTTVCKSMRIFKMLRLLWSRQISSFNHFKPVTLLCKTLSPRIRTLKLNLIRPVCQIWLQLRTQFQKRLYWSLPSTEPWKTAWAV